MKKKKLNLNDLKVNSFVTEAKEINNGTVKGGEIIVPIKFTFEATECTLCYICPS